MGKDVFDLSDVLDGESPIKQVESIPLFIASTVGEQPATLVLPEGAWSDLDRVEFDGGYTDTTYQTDTNTLRRDKILQRPTSWQMILRVPAGTTDNYAIITATSANTASVSYANQGALQAVVAYKSRNPTETKQVIVPVNNGNNVTVNARYVIPASQLPGDFLNSDGTIKDSVKCVAEIYNNSGTGVAIWGETGSYTDYTSQVFASFVSAGKAGNSIAVQTGATSLCERSQYGGSPFGNTNIIQNAPCRLIVWNDQKYSTSIPKADKGYGGLRKDTVDTVALADFTVPNVIDFNLALVSSPLKVTQNVSNNRLSLSQIGIWGSSGSINLTFDSGNNGREIIADIYNETKGQVALEKPEYVARNQLGITIPISVDVLEILTSGDEYSLRVRSNDVFTNVKVGKCWWDVTLNAPL